MIYDENVTELSIRDAFKALNEIDHSFDDALRKQYGSKLNRHGKINEGVSVSLSGMYDEDKLKDKLGEDAGTTLKVIDINADTIEHLRDGKDYVGQLIAKCKVCQALRFMDVDDMKPSQEDPNIYNVDEECPHCHSEGKGFTIVGQVGEAPKEEVTKTEETEAEVKVSDEGSKETVDAEEEATLHNDEAAGEGEELKLETEETETTEADVEETEESSTAEADVSEEESEQEYDETDAEDDTLDLDLPKLGDEVDPDDVKADDTEEAETEEDEEEKTEEKKEEQEVKENLNEEKEDEVKITSAAIVCESVDDLLNNIVNSDCIDDVCCLGGEEDEDIVYNGSCEELPTNIRKAKLKGFNVCGNTFIINIDKDAVGCDLCLRNLLDKFTDNTCDNISLYDVEDDREVFCGTKEDAVKNYGDCAVWSIDKPKAIQFVTDCNTVTPWGKEEVKADEYSNLIADIIRSNGLKEAKINNPKCVEYWIAESIRAGEDLDLIYENYVSNQTEELRQQFKESTGYKDDLDIAIEKREGITETAAREDDVHKALAEAKELAKDTNAFAVIYGYKRSGKFYQLPKMYSCRDDKELKIAHDAVVNKYHTSGMIYTYYRGVTETLHDWSIEDEEAEKATIDHDADKSVMIEEVKEWAKHDLENNSILIDSPEDKEQFRKLLDKSGFKDYDLNELFDWYLTTVGQLDEELNKEVEETEVITEAAQLNGKNDDINKGADLLDKKLTEKKYDVVVVTDDSYPNTVGVLAKDKDTIGRVKNDSKAIFDELGWKVGKVTDSEEDGLFTVMFENITIEQKEEEPQEQAQESLQHFATRKELSEAVMKLKKVGQKYQINKSLKEGYRYELKILDESYNPDDFAADTLDAGSEEYEAEQKALAEIEAEEFDERVFDDDINEYFNNTYDETVIYETLNGSKDKDGNILLEGVVTKADKQEDIKFLLEKVEDAYIVKNNLSEEVFEFKF